ncbi:MAG: GTPase domain-containing protein [Bdellovibrionales bacterium]|nr:GTPase domain-containing protein [Bdellovibrionales bacterium]
MSLINHAAKEVICKVVYVGPGLSGKTTNIQYIYDQTQTQSKGRLMQLSSDNERTLFYDLLPLSIGELEGYRTRFHLYTLPGQIFYDVSRQFVLKGVDGIVFVADSAAERMEANIEAFDDLKKALEGQGYDFDRLPVVFQYNKRDVPSAVTLEELQKTFNPTRRPFFEASANRGKGVMETLQEISLRVIRELKGGEKP